MKKNMIRLRTLCYGITAITIVLTIATFIRISRASTQFTTLSNASERYSVCQDTAKQLRDGSIYLTEQVRLNVATGRKIYMDNYFEEANETRQRDKAVETLEEQFADSKALDYLTVALNESNHLMDTEFHAMKLVAVARGYDINDLEPEIRNYPLSKEEENASSEQLMETATELVNGKEYETARTGIMSAVESCTKDLLLSSNKEFEEAKSIYQHSINMIFAFIGMIVGLNIMYAVLLIRLVVYPLGIYQQCIVNGQVFPSAGVGELRELAENYNAVFIENKEIKILAKANVAVLLFGKEDKLTYINENAKKLFPKMDINSDKLFFREQYLVDDFENLTQKTVFADFGTAKSEESAYLLEHQKLYDKNNNYEGSFFMITDLTKEERKNRETLSKVSRDSLTNLLNQAGFYDKMDRIRKREQKPYKLIVIDISGFRVVNELLGRNKGDEILKHIGGILASYAGTNVAASRIGADRFALFVEKSFDEKALFCEINHYLESVSPTLRIQCKMGVYDEIKEEDSTYEIYQNSEFALYEVDSGADNFIEYFSDKIKEKVLAGNQLLLDMEAGIKEKQFVVYFQPQVDSFSEKVVGGEALVRWNHPMRGFLSPVFFVDLFEKSGKLYDLDYYVWEETCKCLKEFWDKGYEVSLSVNVSPKDIFGHDIKTTMLELVKKYGISPKYLKLEITESTVMYDKDKLRDLVISLNEEGFIVEMDDFGTGYSSLNTLANIPVNIIKTDKGFMDRVLTETKSKYVFGSVIGLARKIGTPVIVEGVETKEQIDYLREIGCHNIQGYYYSKPIDKDEFIKFMDVHGVDKIKL